jgi:hypothetical protein
VFVNGRGSESAGVALRALNVSQFQRPQRFFQRFSSASVLLEPQTTPDSQPATQTHLEESSAPPRSNEEREDSSSACAPLKQCTHAAGGIGAPSAATDRPRREPREDICAHGCDFIVRLVAHGNATANDCLKLEVARQGAGYTHSEVSSR